MQDGPINQPVPNGGNQDDQAIEMEFDIAPQDQPVKQQENNQTYQDN